MPDIMRSEFSRFRERVSLIFDGLHELTRAIGKQELSAISGKLRHSINAPFLFVVVGEVKSGKSSLVNALLGQQVCDVAPDPCTDMIQQIGYAPHPVQEDKGDHLRSVGLPVDILKKIAIVDTPGTNSIIEQHQSITEGFIPESDLVLFVFSAINPYSRTSWDLFDLVHRRWHKKIVFVLQQADRASSEELKVNLDRVRALALERGLTDPKIFTVSAKRAMESGRDPGLEEVWEHIRTTVTGGRHYLLKMESLVDTGLEVVQRIEAEMDSQARSLEADQREKAKILQHLANGENSSLREMEVFKERLLNTYSAVAGEIVAEFEEGLSVGRLVKNSMRSFISRRNVLKSWVDDLGLRFQNELTRRMDSVLKESSAGIAENIAFVMETLLDELKVELKSHRVTMPKGRNISSMTRERFSVIEEVIRKLIVLLSEEEMSHRLRPEGLGRMGDQAVLGGFITAVGALIAGATHAVIFDVTGGIFTTIGALLAINTMVFKRRGVVRRFKQGFAEGRRAFETELAERLATQLQAIFSELTAVFQPYFDNIETREKALDGLRSTTDASSRALAREKQNIDALLEKHPQGQAAGRESIV